MVWSLGNVMAADKVTALLDTAKDNYGPEEERFFPREKAEAIIHAALWGYGSRSGATAGAYAFTNLMEALGIKRWSFKDDWSDIKIDGAGVMTMYEAERGKVATLTAKVAGLEAALTEIRDADQTDMALDPEWPARIARAALPANVPSPADASYAKPAE